MTEKQLQYKRYLKTLHWKQIREKVLQRANGKCEICGYEPWKPTGLQVHHKTYKNRGNERLDDLVAVCPWCHQKVHGICGKRSSQNVKH